LDYSSALDATRLYTYSGRNLTIGSFTFNRGTFTPYLYMNGSGNFGFGTTTPLAKLDVDGNASVSGNLILAGGDRSIQTTANNTLTLGGNTTGNIVLSDPAFFSSSLTIGGDTITDFVGTGLQLNSTTLETTLGTTVSLTSEVTGVLPIANGGTNSTATPTQGGVAYGTGTAYGFTSAGNAGQVLTSNASGAPTWSDASGVNFWSINNGAIYPKTASVLDLLIGGESTSSAKFAVLNVNNGTPTASLSSGLNGTGIYLTASGNLQTTNNQTLTLGGNTTGNISITDNILVNSGNSLTLSGITGNNAILYGTAGTGLVTGASTNTSSLCLMSGASAPTWSACPGSGSGSSKWTLAGDILYPNTISNQIGIGTTTSGDVISSLYVTRDLASGALGKALAIFNQTENQDIFTASASGQTRFVIQNNGNVGIGTTSPNDKLSVVFDDSTGGFTGYSVQNTNAGANAASGMLYYEANGSLAVFQGYVNSSNEFRFNNVVSGGTLNFMAGGSSRLYVKNDGNVGIGTTDPASFKLQVAGDIGPNANNATDLGASGTAFRTGYFGTDVIVGGSSVCLESRTNCSPSFIKDKP
jgi:hypothetical protein